MWLSPPRELALAIPFGRKLSLVLALYRAVDFDAAVAMTHDIQMHQGAGHSVGFISSDDACAYNLATIIPTSRVIVNQAHTFATGGSFTTRYAVFAIHGVWHGAAIRLMKRQL